VPKKKEETILIRLNNDIENKANKVFVVLF